MRSSVASSATTHSLVDGATWAWMAASTVAFLVAGIASLLLATGIETLVLVPAGLEAGAGSFTHGIVLASHVATWALVSVLATLTGASLLLSRPVPLARGARGLLAIGVIVAAAAQLALHEYGRSRFGYFDPRTLGLTSLLPLVLVGLITAWAAVLASGARMALPWGAFVAASVAAVVVLALNLNGAGDGIDPASIPLGVALATAGAYVAGTWIVAWNAWRRSSRLVSESN